MVPVVRFASVGGTLVDVFGSNIAGVDQRVSEGQRPERRDEIVPEHRRGRVALPRVSGEALLQQRVESACLGR